MMNPCHQKQKSTTTVIDREVFDNMDNFYREKLLVEATEEGNFSVMEELINLGVSIETEDYNRFLFYSRKRNMTPLMIAVSRCNLPCVQFLMNKGADINAKDLFGMTATHIAAENGYYHCLKELLNLGADSSVSLQWSDADFLYARGTTPLHLATKNNYPDCVEELLQFNADYNAVDEYDVTPLFIATAAGYEECVDILFKYSAGHNLILLPSLITGDIPLHFAVQHGMVKTVKRLLHLGSDVNHVNRSGSSPLHVCVTSISCDPDVSLEILKLLILYGHKTDINLKDNLKLSPLHYVAFNSGKLLTRRPEMAKFLIAYGANIDIVNHDGVNLMQYEFFSKDTDLSILQACADTLKVLPTSGYLKEQKFGPSNLPRDVMVAFYNMFIEVYERSDNIDLYSQEFKNRPILGTLEENDSHKQTWYRNRASQPCSLLHFCRYYIRSHIGYRNFQSIKKLEVPTTLKSYLLLDAEMLPD